MFWRDQRGVAVAEYALILALVGAFMALASLALGRAVASQMEIANYGPDGVRHVCTSNCQFDYVDYCAAVVHMDDTPGLTKPTFSPALSSNAACNASGVPTS